MEKNGIPTVGRDNDKSTRARYKITASTGKAKQQRTKK